MRIPTIQGIIERRILVNYRIDRDIAARVLPAPFRPKVVNGYAIGGICLIRLKHIRPKCMPSWVGIGSENAAHRYAVEWDQDGEHREGVFIPRRDTSSRLNSMAGGRIFPGVHHHARFDTEETEESLHVSMESDDGDVSVSVTARVAEQLSTDSIFPDLNEASRFFEAGSFGYSATQAPDRFHGLELRCKSWSVYPLHVASVASSHFADPRHFPAGSVAFDCALLMRGIEHEWHALKSLCCTASVGA